MNTEEKSKITENEDSKLNSDSLAKDTEIAKEKTNEKEEGFAIQLEKKVEELNDKVLRLLAENQNIRKNIKVWIF